MGLTYADSGGFVPPDSSGAAGPSSYINTVNQAIGIFSPKATGASSVKDGLDHFFWVTGGLTKTDTGSFHSDPIVAYDEHIGRFIVGDQDVDFDTHLSYFDIAVSTSNNPSTLSTADWKFYQISTTENDGASLIFDADYPGNFGYNADAFVFTLNMFVSAAGDPDEQVTPEAPTGPPDTKAPQAPAAVLSGFHVQVNSVNIQDLANGVSQANLHSYQNDIYGASLRPTTMHTSSPGDPMWLVEQGGGSSIDVVKMTNVLSNSATFTTTNLAVNTYSTANPALNPDGTAITTNTDSRIINASENQNILVASHTVAVSATENDARWYKINLSTGTPVLSDQGDVSAGNNTYLEYPSVEINSAGDMGMSYSRSGTDSPTDFMSMYITGRTATDPAGTMQTPVLVPAGVGTANNGDTRQGDLSGINLDPVNDSFWAVNEFTTNTGFGGWKQAIANFTVRAIVGPYVVSSSPSGTVPGPVSYVDFNFSKAMNTSSFAVAQDIDSFTGPGGVNLLPQVTGYSWSGNRLRVTFAGQAAQGAYSMTIGPDILATNGDKMNQDGDNTLGETIDDRYTASFTIAAVYSAVSYPVESIDLEPGQPGVFTIVDNADDGSNAIDIGTNTFNFYGTSYTGTQIFASSNGLISFLAGNTAYNNTDLSTSPTGPVIAPLWDDWRTDSNANDAVLGKIDGNRLIIEWSQIQHYSSTPSTITFQAILQLNTGANSGNITFNYVDTATGDQYADGASATVGIKPDNADTSPKVLVSYNTTNALVGSGKAILLSTGTPNGPLVINGTANPDNIMVAMGSTVTVTINGVTSTYPASQASDIQVHGNGGDDTLTFTGTSGDETATLHPRSLAVTGSNYQLHADSVETVRVYSAGGTNDVAYLYDSANVDTLISKPAFSQLSGSGYFNYVSNFDKVYSYSTTVGDRAYLYDSAGNDTLTATPLYDLMKSSSYYNYAQGFDSVYAYSTAGGTDVATLYDSAGNDQFLGTPTYAQLKGTGYFNYASGFDQVLAYASTDAGGVKDQATLLDSPGNDTLIGRPSYTELSGTGFLNRVTNFDFVHAYATAGGTNDQAYLYDSAGNDTLIARPTYSQLSGTGYFNYVGAFDKVFAYATAGGADDRAYLYDSSGNDAFQATPTYARMSSSTYVNYAENFDSVYAYASSGTDQAKLYDSAGNDVFIGTPTYGQMKGPGYLNYAAGFDSVFAYATAGNAGGLGDQAALYDSAGNDTLYARTNYAYLTGTGFFNRAEGFNRVYGYALAGGTDTWNLSGVTYLWQRFGAWENII